MASTTTSAGAASLKEYLKRYESRPAADERLKKKKKSKKPKLTNRKAQPLGGVLIVDEDPSWQKPIVPEADDGFDSAGEDDPIVDEDIEVKRLKRLEVIGARKPYLSVSDDGSGWVSVSDPKGETFREEDCRGDLSPPRKTSRGRFHSPSPEHGDHRSKGVRRNSSEIDASPPRRVRKVDLSPPRRVRRDTSEEENLLERLSSAEVRTARLGGDKGSSEAIDLSPPRRVRRGRDSSDSDLSPVRRTGRSSPTADLSPPRRVRRGRDSSDSDLSPVRRTGRSSPTADLSPPRRVRRGRDSTDSDLSPVRRTRRSSPRADLSPPRRARKGSDDLDLSPPRRRRGDSPAEDLSPPRKSSKFSIDDGKKHGRSVFKAQDVAGGVDMSPPRRRDKKLVKFDGLEHSLQKGGGGKQLMEEGKRKGGLYTGSEMREELNRKKMETLSRFESLDPAKSGKGAEPVYRYQGKRISKEDKMKLEKKADEKPKEKKLEWGKGLAQKREAESQALELELEKERPFARSRDDSELDKMLRDRIRWGDPMAHLFKNKEPEINLKDLGDDEKMKESGFIVPQAIPSHSWMKRGIDPPPNRYGIKPGRHWDGVDRSTGYEKELFKGQNEKRATQTEAYLWSVADM